MEAALSTFKTVREGVALKILKLMKTTTVDQNQPELITRGDDPVDPKEDSLFHNTAEAW